MKLPNSEDGKVLAQYVDQKIKEAKEEILAAIAEVNKPVADDSIGKTDETDKPKETDGSAGKTKAK